MSPYFNELAPWERKNEYYETIKLGSDIRTQTELINKSTKAMIGAQALSTNAIISSQERVMEGIDNLSYGIDRVEQGMAGLQAAFEWGISEVVWQIEQNRAVLKTILEVLSAPLDTQARELRKRAEEAYANGWFEDSLEDFLESEKKNRYDFSIHISIGMIYLFQKIDKEKALEYFNKAIKYAKPKSNYHTSFALLHKGLIKRDLGLIEEAEKCASEAVQLSPEFTEAMYQDAQYNAILDKPAKSLQLLKKAIELDVNYCEKIVREKDFEKIEPNITNLFLQLRDKQAGKARNGLSYISKTMTRFEGLVKDIGIQHSIRIKDRDVRNCIDRINILMQRNSYRDYLEANRLIDGFGLLFEKMSSNLKTQLEKIVSSYYSDIYSIKNDKSERTKKSLDRINILWWGIPISILLAFRSCWIKAPGLGGATTTGDAFSSLFKIILCGILVTVAAYHISKAAIKSSDKEVPPGVNSIENKKDQTQRYINALKEIRITKGQPN